MKYFLAVITVVIAIPIFGYLLPLMLISDGVDNYEGTEREYANQALNDLENHLAGPSIYKLYTTKLKVASIQNHEDPKCLYKINIQAYTFFGFKGESYESSACSVGNKL